MTRPLRIVSPDNHYFEVVEFVACGHRFRIYTEDIQSGPYTAKCRTLRRKRLVKRGCAECQKQAQEGETS